MIVFNAQRGEHPCWVFFIDLGGGGGGPRGIEWAPCVQKWGRPARK